MAYFMVALDAKRRPTLPAQLLKEAGISLKKALVARVAGEGRIVLESPEAARAAVRERVRAAARAGSHDVTGDSVADVRAFRDEDNRLVDANMTRRAVSEVSEEESTRRGKALLELLGL